MKTTGPSPSRPQAPTSNPKNEPEVPRSAPASSRPVWGQQDKSSGHGTSSGFEQTAKRAEPRALPVVTLAPVISALAGEKLPRAAQATVSAPQPIASFAFDTGIKAPAQRYDVTVNGKTLPVYMPQTAATDGLMHASIDEIVKGLSRLPPSALKEIGEVRVSPQSNPADAYWAKQYNNPDFNSYMTCGSEGVVRVYPTKFEISDGVMAASMIHESTHAWSQREWGNGFTSAQWKAWQAAGAADGQNVSDYAKNSPGEDVSETTTLFLAVRGTPEFEKYRQAYPNRFAILAQRFGAQS